jgi:hypothetical protein
MIKKRLRLVLIFTILATLLLCVLYITIKNFGPEKQPTISDRICNNLVEAGQKKRDECTVSNAMPDVIRNYFPEGVSVDYVLSAMSDFEIESDWSGGTESCREQRMIRFIVADNGLLNWGEYLFFTFCDRRLVNVVWEN